MTSGPRDLSQAEKKTFGKTEPIQKKMRTAQYMVLGEKSCYFL